MTTAKFLQIGDSMRARSARNSDQPSIGPIQPRTARNSARTMAVAPQISAFATRNAGTVNDNPSRCRWVVTKCSASSRSSTLTSRMRATSLSEGVNKGRVCAHCDDRVKTESADRDVQRRQRTQHVHILQRQRHLLVRFPQGGLLEGFTRIDDAAGQRNLATVAQAIGPHRQDDVRSVTLRKKPGRTRRSQRGIVLSAVCDLPGFFFRKHQQQACRIAGSPRA